MALLTILYGLLTVGLSIYAAYFLWLSLQPLAAAGAPPIPPGSPLPSVTVQLPIYNEKHVAARVIAAVCALDYPGDLLEVQVLDDSTDDTSELINCCVEMWRKKGRDIQLLRRASRQGYKAGALAHGLAQAKGEFVAIFDADFVPEPAWLRHAVAHFCQAGAERLGLVQTRWRHLNDDASRLTRAQAAILDDYAHQQALRAGGGLMPFFNGSAGLWRRDCIMDAGGWSGQTLSEDLDLSYRAHLKGWTVAYDASRLVAAELPARMAAFKRQQYRWAKGPLQATRLLAVPLLRAPIAWRKKADALLFLTGNAIHLLLVLFLLLKLPLLLWPNGFAARLDALLAIGIAGLCAPGVYGWLRGERPAPVELILQCGIALTGARGFLAGLWGPLGGEFQRTPKVGVARGPLPDESGFDLSVLGELALLCVALLCVALAVRHSQWFTVPVLLLFVLGFGWVSVLEIGEALRVPAQDDLDERVL